MVSRPRPDQPERQIWRLLERVDRLETMVYGRNSSVTNGRTRFIGLESLVVIGSQLVEGLLDIVGQLRIRGTGQLEVEGSIDLTGDMTVTGGGQIIVGDMVIDPADGGSVTFPGGAVVRAGVGGGVELREGSNFVYAGAGGVLIGQSGNSIFVNNGYRFNGLPTITETASGGHKPGAVIATSAGDLRRVISD